MQPNRKLGKGKKRWFSEGDVAEMPASVPRDLNMLWSKKHKWKLQQSGDIEEEDDPKCQEGCVCWDFQAWLVGVWVGQPFWEQLCSHLAHMPLDPGMQEKHAWGDLHGLPNCGSASDSRTQESGSGFTAIGMLQIHGGRSHGGVHAAGRNTEGVVCPVPCTDLKNGVEAGNNGRRGLL